MGRDQDKDKVQTHDQRHNSRPHVMGEDGEPNKAPSPSCFPPRNLPLHEYEECYGRRDHAPGVIAH